MAFAKFVFFSALVVIAFEEIHGHGKLMDPVNRSSAWRDGFDTPRNDNDNENFCGGQFVQHNTNGGKCGPCGDDFRAKQPRNNENGGKFGRGIIVKKYTQGEHFQAIVDLTAYHEGYFQFAVCPLNGPTDIETEECFDQHPVKLADGSDKFYPVTSDLYNIDLVLPAGLTCEHCTFRWNYRCGNTWGWCGDGTGKRGCGPQETFRSCSDISIL